MKYLDLKGHLSRLGLHLTRCISVYEWLSPCMRVCSTTKELGVKSICSSFAKSWLLNPVQGWILVMLCYYCSSIDINDLALRKVFCIGRRHLGPVVRVLGLHVVAPGSNPDLTSGLDLFPVVPDTTPPHFVNRQLAASCQLGFSIMFLLSLNCFL